MSIMSVETRIRMVARTAILHLDDLVEDGLVGPALDALIMHAEALAVSPRARAVSDPLPHLFGLREILEAIHGCTADRLVGTLDDLIVQVFPRPRVGR